MKPRRRTAATTHLPMEQRQMVLKMEMEMRVRMERMVQRKRLMDML
ncbi:hypothetical protein Z043_107366 [Scleropages formosus]|uniref:Uncharacterized protein n=1 Tax=Scleropages formosus TaxID=113540 RepID=A0A0P7UH50_SCLFO|nr:hypothetical protein Z043_107366 [Scleropages formosus]